MDILLRCLFIYILIVLGLIVIAYVVATAKDIPSTEDWVRHYYDVERKRAEEWDRKREEEWEAWCNYHVELLNYNLMNGTAYRCPSKHCTFPNCVKVDTGYFPIHKAVST